MDTCIIAALKRIAEDVNDETTLAYIVQSLRRIAEPSETLDDAAFERKHPRGEKGKFAHVPSASEKSALERGEHPGGEL